MSWTCPNCNQLNERLNRSCIQCSMSKETAIISTGQKSRRKMCPVCFHRHQEGAFCHMFCAGIFDHATNRIISECYQPEDENTDDDEDDDNMMILDNKLKDGKYQDMSKILSDMKEAKKQEKLRKKPLETPSYVMPFNYVRCNCREGVPSNNRMYEAIPNPMKLGDIHVRTYERILADDGNEYRKFKNYDEKIAHDKAKRSEIQQHLIPVIPYILSYLRIPECKNAPLINRYWNIGVYGYRDYIDLRDCVPSYAYRPHHSNVESLLVYDDMAFTAGDHRIYASNYKSGDILETVARTAGEVPSLTQFHDEMFYADVNGSIRSSIISHDPKNMIPDKTLWDHTRSVTKIVWNLPTIGMCNMHGIIDHVCTMFTCSEDRSIRVWNTTSYECLKILDTKTMRTSSFLSMAQSGRHLFVGTTNARIGVFSKHNFCDRDDIHDCNTPGNDKSYCLQITLKLPEHKLSSGNHPGVSHMMCAGPNYEFSMLWAGDMIGYITLWTIPDHGLEFIPYRSWQAHDGAVTGLTSTWRHGISIGDDGKMFIYDLMTLELMRKIDVISWCVRRGLVERPDVPRKMKSLSIHEDFDKGGTLLIGTSYGDVIVINIGTQV